MTGMKMEEVYGHHPENDAAHDEASVTSCGGQVILLRGGRR